MTHEEAIAEAKRRQASDPDASWIATSRDGEWTVVRIGVAPTKVVGTATKPPPVAPSRRSAFSDRASRVVRWRRELKNELAIHFRPPSMGWVGHEGQRLRRYSQTPEGLRPRFQGACDSAERSPRLRRYETARVPSGAKWIGSRNERSE